MGVWQYLRDGLIESARSAGSYDENLLRELTRQAGGFAALQTDNAAYREPCELFRTLPAELQEAVGEYRRREYLREKEMAEARAFRFSLNTPAAGGVTQLNMNCTGISQTTPRET